MSSTAKWRKFTRQEIEMLVQESYSYATLAEKLGYHFSHEYVAYEIFEY